MKAPVLTQLGVDGSPGCVAPHRRVEVSKRDDALRDVRRARLYVTGETIARGLLGLDLAYMVRNRKGEAGGNSVE